MLSKAPNNKQGTKQGTPLHLSSLLDAKYVEHKVFEGLATQVKNL